MINVIMNIALFIFKYIGGRLSNSVSVMADAFNNLSDAGTTLATYFGVKIASIGSGERHPNGHGRFEWIIALLSSTSVIIIGWELAGDSLDAIKNPEVSVFSLFTVLVLIVSISVKLFMYFYNLQKGRENDSQSYEAIAADSLSDAISTAAVLVSFIIDKLTGMNVDGWCGILVSIFIIYNGFKSFCETAGRIMGKAPSREELAEMRKLILENKDFKDVYDLQIEDFGYGRRRVSLIVLGKKDVDGDKLISDVAESTAAIYESFGYNVLMQVEKPLENEDNQYIKDIVEKIISDQKVEAKLISMYLSAAGKRTKVRLEIGISHEKYNRLEEIEKNISEQLKKLPPEYVAVPKVRLMRDRHRMRKMHKYPEKPPIRREESN